MKSAIITALMMMILMSACSSSLVGPNMGVTCGIFRSERSVEASCGQQADDTHFLQTASGEQATFYGPNSTLTVAGSALLVRDSAGMTILTMDGISVFSALGVTRVVQAGSQIRLELSADGRILRQPETARIMDQDLIPEPATLPLASATIASTQIEGQVVEECSPQESWQDSYTIQPGDTLFGIAQRFDITIDELQDANCITNPDRIARGQVLRLPTGATTGTTTAQNSPVFFQADQTIIVTGSCTMLRWQISNMASAFIEDTEVPELGSARICPTATTDFTLRITYTDNSTSEHVVIVEVSEQP